MVIYFSLGSNLGNREENLHTCLQSMSTRVGKQLACSSIYYNPAQGFRSNHEFANMVVAYETALSPEAILAVTQQIEREIGRTNKSEHGIYHDRVIDIDLLQYFDNAGEEVTLSSPALTLPHPKMKERDFVLIPLQELHAPSYPPTHFRGG